MIGKGQNAQKDHIGVFVVNADLQRVQMYKPLKRWGYVVEVHVRVKKISYAIML